MNGFLNVLQSVLSGLESSTPLSMSLVDGTDPLSDAQVPASYNIVSRGDFPLLATTFPEHVDFNITANTTGPAGNTGNFFSSSLANQMCTPLHELSHFSSTGNSTDGPPGRAHWYYSLLYQMTPNVSLNGSGLKGWGPVLLKTITNSTGSDRCPKRFRPLNDAP